MEMKSLSIGLVACLALLCQYGSVSTGMGYGTALTPLLLIAGFPPLQVIPAVLLSQFVGATAGGLAHHRAGNISLDFRRDEKAIEKRLRGLGYLPRSLDSKIVFSLAAWGVVGIVVGVLTAVNIPRIVLETYIGVVVLGIGLAIIWRRSHKSGKFSWKGLTAVGILGAFNKGVSGGGYVPLVTGGQIISGREARSSVGNTTVAVAVVCVVGFVLYLVIGNSVDWVMAGAASVGSLVAAPLAALTVKRANTEKLRLVIGLVIVALGVLTLLRTFIF
jgi:hypothetical protein